jgi:hypothetical protein
MCPIYVSKILPILNTNTYIELLMFQLLFLAREIYNKMEVTLLLQLYVYGKYSVAYVKPH